MTVKLLSSSCVNSRWRACGLHDKGEHCECGYECKVRVSVERNGHAPYEYILTVKEYKRLKREEAKRLAPDPRSSFL